MDFVHGDSGGQKSRGRRTLMPVRTLVRACVCVGNTRVGRLEKGDADGKRRTGRVAWRTSVAGQGWCLKRIDKRAERGKSSAAAAAGYLPDTDSTAAAAATAAVDPTRPLMHPPPHRHRHSLPALPHMPIMIVTRARQRPPAHSLPLARSTTLTRSISLSPPS